MCRGTIGAAENDECRVSCKVEENDVLAGPQRRNGGIFTSHFRLWGFCQDLIQGATSHHPLRNSYATDMARIYDLPNELILHIVSYIKNHSTLHNLQRNQHSLSLPYLQE